VARFLALDWNGDRIYAVLASVARGRVRIEQAHSWQETATLNLSTADSIGARLRDKLKALNLPQVPVLVSLGREQVVSREARFPRTDPAQEPAIVRFQATKDLTEPVESVVIDYATLDRPGPSGEQRALVQIVRKDIVNAYKALCRAAGVKLFGLTPRPFALGAWLGCSAEPDEHAAALAALSITETRAELCVVRGHTVLFSRTLPAQPASLAAEVRRNFLLYSGQSQVDPAADIIQALCLAKDAGVPPIEEALHQQLGIPIRPLTSVPGQETTEAAEKSGSFAGALGLVQLWAETTRAPINFIAPKEPAVPTDTPRKRVLQMTVIGICVLVGLVCFGKLLLAFKDADVDKLRQESSRLEGDIRGLEPDSKYYDDIKKWEDAGLPLLDELYDLTARFPYVKGLRVTSLTITPLAQRATKDPNAPKDPFVLRMKIVGQVSDHDAKLVNQLATDLTRNDPYRRSVASPLLVTSGDTPKGPGATPMKQFTVQIDLARRPREDYTLHFLPPAAASEPAGPGGRGNMFKGFGGGGRGRMGRFGQEGN
jgi:Tfp pilus assembly PilM family ATPase